MKRVRIKINSGAAITPLLETGDGGVNVDNDTCLKAAAETRRVKGMVVFSDGSSTLGDREYFLGEFIYRVNDQQVEAAGFQPLEFFAPKEDG